MENWKEKIDSEIKRREIEVHKVLLQPIEALKVIMPAMSEDEKEKMRIAKIDSTIQKLSQEERNAFGLLDRIGANQMLKDIGSEIWGNGSRVEPYGINNRRDIKRGSQLVFIHEYADLDLRWTHHTKRKFGFYKEISGGETNFSHGEISYSPSSEQKRFGWHDVPDPSSNYRYASGFEMKRDISEIDIYIQRSGVEDEYFRRWGDYKSFNFALRFWGGMKNPEALTLDLRNLDEIGAKKFLEQQLLDNCIERKTKGFLPVDVLARNNLSKGQAEQAVREHRKF